MCSTRDGMGAYAPISWAAAATGFLGSRGIAGQNARDAPKGRLPLVIGSVYKQFDHLKSNG